eukprot:scaffold21710_cov36-Cyclotella_meneghiniana.AAC.2
MRQAWDNVGFRYFFREPWDIEVAPPFTMKCAVAPESRIAYSVGVFSLSVLSSSEDSSSSERVTVGAVALSHSCFCEQFDVTTVSSSSSVVPVRIL